MTGRRFTLEEKKFRALLRSGICKPRLARWFQDAGLTDVEKDILFRAYLRGSSREAIARETYSHVSTICSKATKAINKLYDYFRFSNILESEDFNELSKSSD